MTMEIEITHLDESIYDNDCIKVATKKGNTNTQVSLPSMSIDDLKLLRNVISFYIENETEMEIRTKDK